MAAANPRKYLDKLMISKVRIKAIRYFLLNDEPIHLRGAVREFNEEINAVRRELERMESIGMLISERRGNRKYFRLDKDFTFYEELLGLAHKTFGLGGEVVAGASKLGDVKYALLTQGFTYGEPVGMHQMDLVVVGDDIDIQELDSIVSKEERKLGRDIHYTVLTAHDFELRKRRRDAFIQELMVQDVIMLVGRTVDFLRMDS